MVFEIKDNVLVQYSGKRETVIIPDGIVSIDGEKMFDNDKVLKKVILPEGLQHIGSYAFFNCIYLEAVEFPSSLKTISRVAFAKCVNLETVELPGNLETINDEAFAGCERLHDINIPTGVSIGAGVFRGCSGLADADGFVIISDVLCYYCGTNPYPQIPTSVTKIDKSAFAENKVIRTVEIPANVKTIGEKAFYSCPNLLSVTLHEGLVEIEENAFNSATSLKQILLPRSLKKLGHFVFSLCFNLESIFLSNRVKIDKYTFSGLKSKLCMEESTFNLMSKKELECINVVICSRDDFQDSIKNEKTSSSIHIQDEHKNLLIEDDILVSCFTDEESVSLPDGITEIGKSAFSTCKNLNNIVIPLGVKTIGKDAFQYCENLKNVILPEGVNLIGSSAFSSCKNLISINLPDSITEIETGAFWQCVKLREIKLPQNLTTIKNATFLGCANLVSINIPENIRSIGEHAFDECYKLEGIMLPKHLDFIGKRAFSNCEKLTRLGNIENIDKIGPAAFSNCSGLADQNGFVIFNGVLYCCFKEQASVMIPDDVKEISDDAFWHFRSFNTVYDLLIHDRVEVIRNLFQEQEDTSTLIRGPISVKRISIPEKLITKKGISIEALIPCEDLNWLVITESNQAIMKIGMPDKDEAKYRAEEIREKILRLLTSNENIDEVFEEFKCKKSKFRFALGRLLFPQYLSEISKAKYVKYLSVEENIKNILRMCMFEVDPNDNFRMRMYEEYTHYDFEDFKVIIKAGCVTEKSIDMLIDLAQEQNRPEYLSELHVLKNMLPTKSSMRKRLSKNIETAAT